MDLVAARAPAGVGRGTRSKWVRQDAGGPSGRWTLLVAPQAQDVAPAQEVLLDGETVVDRPHTGPWCAGRALRAPDSFGKAKGPRSPQTKLRLGWYPGEGVPAKLRSAQSRPSCGSIRHGWGIRAPWPKSLLPAATILGGTNTSARSSTSNPARITSRTAFGLNRQ